MNFILLISLSGFIFFQNYYTGTVLKVTDGDTFVLQTSEGNLKVRLDGIDAPEGKQLFGKESKVFLTRYQGKKCKVLRKGTDRFGRTIGILFIDNVNINLLLVQEGFAWHFKKYSKDKALADAETLARSLRKGLWQNPDAIPPWEWRAKK